MSRRSTEQAVARAAPIDSAREAAGVSGAGGPGTADPVAGAAAFVTADGALLLAGGTSTSGPSATRTLPLGCAADCVATPSAELTPSLALTAARLAPLSATSFLLLGDHAGLDRAFLVELSAGAREVSLREPRSGSALVRSPSGQALLLGGKLVGGGPALTVEALLDR